MKRFSKVLWMGASTQLCQPRWLRVNGRSKSRAFLGYRKISRLIHSLQIFSEKSHYFETVGEHDGELLRCLAPVRLRDRPFFPYIAGHKPD